MVLLLSGKAKKEIREVITRSRLVVLPIRIVAPAAPTTMRALQFDYAVPLLAVWSITCIADQDWNVATLDEMIHPNAPETMSITLLQ